MAEALARRERLRAAGVDPAQALPAAIQELFEPEAWWTAILDWRRERGKSLEGWTLEGEDIGDSAPDAR